MAKLGRAKRRKDARACPPRLPRMESSIGVFPMLATAEPSGYKGAIPERNDLPPGAPEIAVKSASALILLRNSIGEWCNGSTTDSDSVCLGSNPGSPAKSFHGKRQAVRSGPASCQGRAPPASRCYRIVKARRKAHDIRCNSRPTAGTSHDMTHQP